MGMSVEAHAGLGLNVPASIADSNDIEFDVLEDNGLDLLVFQSSIWGYETSGGGVFLRSQFQSSEEGEPFSFVADGSVQPTEAEAVQLQKAAEILEIPYVPKFVFLHSYMD